MTAARRPPQQVMRLARMGAFFPTRLSFMRQLLRRLVARRAVVQRPHWQMNNDGHGTAVYTLPLDGKNYSLVVFSNPLANADRSDRVIANAWDSSCVLYDGIPTAADITRLAANAPRQEKGRFSGRELVLSRANKSVRLFEHVVAALARGAQPDADALSATGYLMRTTAVYGNGKFGIADRRRFCGRTAMASPFQAELLAVWLLRGFTHDLAEHIAYARNPRRFIPLTTDVKRRLGIGNATGLGMAPFLVNHPVLLHHWMQARETALARVRALPHTDAATIRRTRALIHRAQRHLSQWNVEDKRQMQRIRTLRREWATLQTLASEEWLAAAQPWERLFQASADMSLECQELTVALLLEPHGDVVDDLADAMATPQRPQLAPAMPVGELLDLIQQRFGWALAVDFNDVNETRRFWYVSEEKMEPRLGDRHVEAGAELELPLDIARRMQAAATALAAAPATQSTAAFLAQLPQHRYAVRRAQNLALYPYAEIQDNLIGEQCLPIDMLRCKLSFFGATKFDPKSERWTRISLYQDAPLFKDIADGCGDDWWLAAEEKAPAA